MPKPWSLTVFDGHRSIGGTKILFEQRGQRLLLDFGTNYKRQSEYYEEYLKPRASRGLFDFLELGLLPRQRGFYRRDLFPPSDFRERDDPWPGARPDALLLTHGHLDHSGGLAFLDPTIPVLCTPLTAALLRAWQETSQPAVTSEVAYVGERVPTEGASPGRSSPGRTLGSDRRAVRSGRVFRLLGTVPGALAEELRRSPFHERTPFQAADPSPAPVRFDDVRVEHHPVDHSVYGAVAFLVEADGARIAYTGDFRFQGTGEPLTRRFLSLLERNPPDILIIEGTRLRKEGDDRAQPRVGEADVERNCRALVERYAGKLVVADFGPRNVERLRLFRRVALDTGRQLVLTPKDAHLLRVLHAADPTIEVDIGTGTMRILEEPSTGPERPWLRRVGESFRDAFLGPGDIERSPGRWILCFSFFDCNDLVDLRRATRGGLWLYSSSEAHGEEQEFDFRRLQNWIEWAGMDQVGFRLVRDEAAVERPRFDLPEDVGHHASGHATEAELLEFVRRAEPRYVVPVHTEQTPERYAKLLASAGASGRVVAPAPGEPIAWG